MLKLPICPYCGARFLYPDVKKRKGSTGTCPHCRKKFHITAGRGLAVLLPAAVLFLIAINFLLLTIPDINIFYLMAVTAAGVILTYFLMPYTVRYRPLK